MKARDGSLLRLRCSLLCAMIRFSQPPPALHILCRAYLSSAQHYSTRDQRQTAHLAKQRIDRAARSAILLPARMPKWRNWQTRYVQGVVPFGECGFDSHLRHRINPVKRPGFPFHEIRWRSAAQPVARYRIVRVCIASISSAPGADGISAACAGGFQSLYYYGDVSPESVSE